MHHVQLRALGSEASPHHIRGSITDHNDDYLLEIGNHCNADPRILALAALAPEIDEFLLLLNSPMAKLLLNKWRDVEYTLRNRQRTSEYGFSEVSS